MTDLTPEALDQLEGLAKEATQGEWRHAFHIDFPYESGYEVYLAPADGGYFGSGGRIGEAATSLDAKYIAAANPATILALITEVRRLRFDIGLATDHATGLEQWIESKGWCVPGGQEIKQCAEAICDCGYEGIFTEVKQLREDLAETNHQLDVDRKHAALAEGEACDVCSHLEIEQMARHDIELMEENDALLAKIKRVREAADRIDERSAAVILRTLDGGDH